MKSAKPAKSAPFVRPGAGFGSVGAISMDDDMVDGRWDLPPKTNRLIMVLVVLLIAAGAFCAGALTQQWYGTGALSDIAGPPGGLPRRPDGLGPPGADGAAGAGQEVQIANPVAIGTIQAVTAGKITVQDFAGKTIIVRVPATAQVTVFGLRSVSVGMTVSVSGIQHSDGTIQAVAMTVRGA